ncbi:MAG: molybdopterin cofactor-binding domain-containing protein [Candidatus Acidiferrales bacterium]
MSDKSALAEISRRNFLQTTAAGGAALVIGFCIPELACAKNPEAHRVNPFNAWVQIADDGKVTLILAKSEMGQGIYTSLPMILADELEVDWKSVSVRQAETKPEIYPESGTGGSGSVSGSFLPLRQAGAAAREMLITAAAQTWGVDPVTCHATNGTVVHDPRAHRLAYAELVAKASALPVPDLTKVTLKNPDNFQFIGKSLPHLDIPSKVDGTAQFGIDVRVPGMLYAVIARCPVFEGKVKSFDAAKAKAVPGVRAVVEIPAVVSNSHTAGGIAVVAESTWAAIRGRDALQIEWDNGAAASESSDSLRKQMQSLTDKPGTVVEHSGNADAALAKAAKKIEAAYELPFLAHATMEPMNCTADIRSDRAEVWAPTQGPIWIRDMVAQVSGLPKESVIVHTTLMGGGFGRRYQSDFGVEAAQVSKAVGKPVQVVWTREDDMQHDFYRPAFQHRIAAALDDQARVTAWRHRVSSTPIATYWNPKRKPDESEIGSGAHLPYAIDNFQVEYSPATSAVPRAWWRSVEQASSAFAVESFIDELAAAAKVDPLAFRLRAMRRGNEPAAKENVPDVQRFKAVLTLAAEKAGWDRPAPAGRSRGIAAFFSFDSYLAEVAEVSIAPGGKLRVHRVTCAVDCGRVVDPNGVKAQVESAVVYALSATLMGEITIAGGKVEQSNFDTYPVLRMREMPEVEVHIVPSTKPPTGIGEPGVPPLAPAVTNAIFAATGKRIRRLPIRPEDLA